MHKRGYVVREQGSRVGNFTVMKVNMIGQGWTVATYSDQEKAQEVATFLNSQREYEAE